MKRLSKGVWKRWGISLGAALLLASAGTTVLAAEEPLQGEHVAHPQAIRNGETPETANAAGGADATEAQEAEGEHALKPINWTDFDNKKQVPYVAYLFNFALLVFIYVYFGRKPISAGLRDRKDSIAKEIEEAARMKKEAKARAKKYQAKLQGLDAELASAKSALIEAGKADKERIVREAREKAERMERDAKALLESESRQAHHDLVQEAIEAAVREAEELLKKRVMPEDHERLAEDFLASLGKKSGGPSLAPPAAGGAS